MTKAKPKKKSGTRKASEKKDPPTGSDDAIGGDSITEAEGDDGIRCDKNEFYPRYDSGEIVLESDEAYIARHEAERVAYEDRNPDLTALSVEGVETLEVGLSERERSDRAREASGLFEQVLRLEAEFSARRDVYRDARRNLESAIDAAHREVNTGRAYKTLLVTRRFDLKRKRTWVMLHGERLGDRAMTPAEVFALEKSPLFGDTVAPSEPAPEVKPKCLECFDTGMVKFQDAHGYGDRVCKCRAPAEATGGDCGVVVPSHVKRPRKSKASAVMADESDA